MNVLYIDMFGYFISDKSGESFIHTENAMIAIRAAPALL